MPAFAQSAGGMLTGKQIDVIVGGIRERWSKPDVLRGANPPPYSSSEPGDPSRGSEVYANYCSSCHGAGGRGGQKASSIVDGSFLALLTDQELRTIVIVGRPELGAPDWRGNVPGKPMSAQDVSDVVAWLASQRPKFPGQPYPNIAKDDRRSSMTLPGGVTRRDVLMKIGILLQWHRRRNSRRADRALSSLSRCPRTEGRLRVMGSSRQSRTVSFRPDSPGHLSQSGRESHGWRYRGYRLLGSQCGRAKLSRSLRSIARTSDARFAGSRNRVSLCAHVTAALTIRTVPAPPARLNADCSSIPTGLKTENC